MSSKLKDLLDTINKFFHKDRNIAPTTIPPNNIAQGLTELAGHLTFSAPDHSRREEGLPPKMTFLKTGTPDELYVGIYAFCNCSNTGSPSTPCIRLTNVPDKQDDEHIITTPVTITSAGILYNAEVSESEWFRAFQTGLDLPFITPD